MFPIVSPSPLFVESTSAIASANKKSIRSKSKHIDQRFHYITQQIQDGSLVIHHVPTSDILANFLTKTLGPQGVVHALEINKFI